LFSILFFIVELHAIVAAQRGRTRALWLLPVVFVLWANMHIEFVLGLTVLVAAIVAAVWVDAGRVAMRQWIAIGIASCVATLVNPYHVRLYFVARQYMGQTDLLTRIGEFVAPTFRSTPDWVVLAFALTAAGCLGWQFRERTNGIFWVLLFGFGAWLGFRMQRDAWVLVVAAACIIAKTAQSARPPNRDTGLTPQWFGTIIALGTAAVLLVFAALPIDESRLEAHVARSYPVAAATFVETKNLGGPLYNYFDWGGYLMWNLPRLPVSMDGRTPVHGAERIVRHVDTWQGKPGWRDDPELATAALVIGPQNLPLTSLLRLDERFALVYEDRAGPAVVFARR